MYDEGFERRRCCVTDERDPLERSHDDDDDGDGSGEHDTSRFFVCDHTLDRKNSKKQVKNVILLLQIQYILHPRFERNLKPSYSILSLQIP
jgi:hypothetical protein